jgi:Bacterial Ig domain/Hyaluronidase
MQLWKRPLGSAALNFFIAIVSAAIYHVAPAFSSEEGFGVYDSIISMNKPDLTAYGLRPMLLIYTGALWPAGTSDFSQPNEAQIRKIADQVASLGNTGPVALDIEHWNTDIRGVSLAEADSSIAKLRQMLAWFKDQVPQTQDLGYYSLPPLRDYWASVANNTSWLAAWQSANDYHAPLTNEVGALYPSLYTFYENRAGWVNYARANIAEAKRLAPGRPVYPFLWMQYHDSAGALARTYIPYDFWKLQLQTIKDAGADGVVIWGGVTTGGNPDSWDENRGWWIATKDFMSTLSTSNPSDTTFPTVSTTAPASGAAVSGSAVTVSANASDNVGVVGVQFKLDGTNLGTEDLSSPYSVTWNTTTAANGTHILTAVARDAAGNTGTSAGVSAAVNNPTGDTTSPVISNVEANAGTTSAYYPLDD